MNTISKWTLQNNPNIWGRVKLSDKSPVYKNKWVQLIGVEDRGVSVFIEPVERFFTHEEVAKVELAQTGA